ncbi:MAG: DUF4256 domain-containing protein [Chitinophagaceae bacterium]|nr:DUF4256 domain-containing protein [Chitinophagaceae bacterium]
MKNGVKLSKERVSVLFRLLQERFEKNSGRHRGVKWSEVQARLEKSPRMLWSLNEMEETGGEPDVIGYDKKKEAYLFCDCSPESPKERRGLCYDHEALESRKEFKPKGSAMQMAAEMGIALLTEEQYMYLQQFGKFDTKTSSWLVTPASVRQLGGAIFGDCRFGRTFIYHNGAESYYAARGFRGILAV